MTRGTRWVAVVASALILAGCRNLPSPRTEPLVVGELPYQCVWTTCSPASLAINRCAARTSDTRVFEDCMRDQGYQPFKCEAGTPNCTPKLEVLY